MKKIIDGRLYDTDTAKRVGGYAKGFEGVDSDFVMESLYRKETGEFFLYGGGGPKSDYAEHSENTSCAGEAIRPLSIDEAKEWAEKHLSGDEYIEIFGEVKEE